MAHVCFTTRPETAAWGAELAAALTPDASDLPRARVYEVEPTGPFQDDPNVTGKRLPGNPTRSCDPLRVVTEVFTEVTDCPKHSPEELEGMLTGLARLRAQGLDVVYD